MSFNLQCSCGTRFDVGMELAGRTAACPACGKILNLPTSDDCAAVSREFAPPADPERGTHLASRGSGIHAVDGRSDDTTQPAPPPYRLATALQVGAAAFFGGPLGGFLLIGLNYGRLGRRAAAWGMYAVGFLLTIAAIAAALSLPESSRVSGFVFSGIFVAIAYATAKATQGATLEQHQARGGELASTWTVASRALVGLVVTIAIGFGGAAVDEIGFGDQSLQVNGLEEIQYGRDVTETEANNLARVLQENGFFNGESAKTVRLSRDHDKYVVSFILASGFFDVEINREFLALAEEISHAFGGRSVRVELCDRWGIPKMKLPAQHRP